MKIARRERGEKQNALINKLPPSAAMIFPTPPMEMHPTVRMKLKIKQHSGRGTTRIEYPLGVELASRGPQRPHEWRPHMEIETLPLEEEEGAEEVL